jgi:GR25 family glycosyltransferase involved in LPS biosynthesis
MQNLHLEDFYRSGKISTAIKLLSETSQKNPEKTLQLCKLFKKIFPSQTDLLLYISDCALRSGEWLFCHEVLNDIKKTNIKEQFLPLINTNERACIPYICDNYINYNRALVEQITKRTKNPEPLITFTITTCKRYNLFEKTMNSFLNCCLDLNRIDRWLCVDDNSTQEDREKMKSCYPFFDFYFKDESEKGHVHSMNIIKNKVVTPFIFHMEDDWKFFYPRNYITDCLDVITQTDCIGQCLINKNYAETEKDFSIIGGFLNRTNGGTRYFIHQHCQTKEEYDKFYSQHKAEQNAPNCAYWKHYSLRPSLLKKQVWDDVGAYNTRTEHFEREYSERYMNSQYVSAFLDGIYCLHTGRLTSEREDKTKQNAYSLNNVEQFGKQVSKPAIETIPEIKLKTFVINLDRRQDRWEMFQEHKEPRFLDYERFSAVDGSKLKPNKQLQRIFQGNDYNMAQGMVGCAMSHLKLFIQLINSDYDAYVIFEDDIKFCNEFEIKFNKIIGTLPGDFDFCYLGYHLRDKNNSFYTGNTSPIAERWNTEKIFSVSLGGTYGYIVSKKGAQNFLNLVNEIGMINCVDTLQQKTADYLHVYYSVPMLVYSECYRSDTTKIDTDIQFNLNSLNYTETLNSDDYPELLKKDDRYNIDDALTFY